MAFQRELIADLAGRRFSLVATWRASEEIANRVADPIFIQREAALVQMNAEIGLPYQPRFSFSVSNVAEIIWIGAKAGGEKVGLEEVKDAVFEGGYEAATRIASEYLELILGPKPTVEVEASKETPAPGE